MMAEIIQFPGRKPEPEDVIAVVDQAQGRAKTVVISSDVLSIPGEAFPFPSAPAVDSRYMRALEEQKKKQNG
jgi:hypothetical protein